MPRAKRWWAIGVLVVGPILVAGPFMIMKGGISTKPSILRILGLGQAAPAMAVERERPLDPDQTTVKTICLATRAMIRAVDGATSLPLLLLAPLGIAASWVVALRRQILASARHDRRALDPGHDSTARDVRLLHASPCHGCRLDLDSGQRGRAQSAGRRTGPGDRAT